MRAFLVFVLLCAGAGYYCYSHPDLFTRTIPWETSSLDASFQKAKDGHRPMLVFFTQPG